MTCWRESQCVILIIMIIQQLQWILQQMKTGLTESCCQVFFIQDEIKITNSQKLLLGARYDHHSVHGNIFTPRAAYKLSLNKNNVLRLNAGTGFRVVNLFTEDHAALTGAREVVITERLKPEQSYNVNLNYTSRIPMLRSFIGLDASIWYTHFSNQIFPDLSC